MKAFLYEKKSKEKFVLREIDKPQIKDNEVLVKVYSVSLNAADYRSINIGMIPKSKIFGADIAGKIIEIGKEVEKFKIGDEVIADNSGNGFGGLAEYVAIPEVQLVIKPQNMSFKEAASIPMASGTALQAFSDKGNINFEEKNSNLKILIWGASGGVGTFAVQLAKHIGANITAVTSERNSILAKELGADNVLDYKNIDYKKLGNGYDIILAINGENSLSFYHKLLNKKGIFIVVGGSISQLIKTILFGKIVSIFGKKKMTWLVAKPKAKDLKYIIKLVEESEIRPIIDKVYKFEETASAMEYISSGHSRGKVVVEIE